MSQNHTPFISLIAYITNSETCSKGICILFQRAEKCKLREIFHRQPLSSSLLCSVNHFVNSEKNRLYSNSPPLCDNNFIAENETEWLTRNATSCEDQRPKSTTRRLTGTTFNMTSTWLNELARKFTKLIIIFFNN